MPVGGDQRDRDAEREERDDVAVVAEIASPTTAPTIEPARPIASVSQIGIGSGPGIASRASAPVMKPGQDDATTKPTLSAEPTAR